MTTKIPNIQRIDTDSNSTHCWLVIVQRRSIIYRKMFADGVYGSKNSALRNAKRWRDEVIAIYRPLSKREYISIKRKNNKSGIPGVCKYASRTILATGKKTERWYWSASWAIKGGRRKQLKFSINKYGDEVAFEKACAARREAINKVEGIFLPNAG